MQFSLAATVTTISTAQSGAKDVISQLAWEVHAPLSDWGSHNQIQGDLYTENAEVTASRERHTWLWKHTYDDVVSTEMIILPSAQVSW